MRPQYSVQLLLNKILFFPRCQLCGSGSTARSGKCCTSCMRAILRAFKGASGDPEALLAGGGATSMRLVGVLREERAIWARRVFLRLLERKFSTFSGIGGILLVPQRRRGAPSGLKSLCEGVGTRHRLPVLGGLAKERGRSQHGNPARERMDRERFITCSEIIGAKKVLLVDDVETTGTSMLQAELALCRSGAKVQKLALVKAGWEGEQEHSKKKGRQVE